jgi:signal transduction histidine kinase/ligand-binding sensor domain-containing protein
MHLNHRMEYLKNRRLSQNGMFLESGGCISCSFRVGLLHMSFGLLRRSAVCLTIALMWAAESPALEPGTPLARFSRQSWGMENGLPQNTVSVLLQSRSGFLWAGTELGLARFDGVGFRVFDHATAAAFPDAEIRCLLDAGNGLWVGTGDGLVRWRDGRAVLLTTRDGLPTNSIRGLAQTTDGTVWVWTEAGLARWTGQHFQTVGSANRLRGEGITSVAADSSGGLWVGTTSGAAVFRDGRWLLEPDWEMQKNARHGANLGLNAEANSGLFPHFSLVAAVTGGDVLISTAGGIFLQHKGTVTGVLAEAALPADGVSFLGRLTNGTVAVASKSTVVLAQSTDSGGHVVGRFAVSQQLPGSRIETIFADREGCLWVGTNRGLARIALNQSAGARRAAMVERFPSTDPLAANAIVALLEDREGDLWVGTETAGMHILRDARFRIVGSSDGLSSDATTAIVQDSRDTLWIGTRDSGLNSIAAGQNTSRMPTNLTTADGLLSNVILALAASPGEDVWVGTPDGLNRIGNRGISSFTSADGLPDDFIRSLLVAPDDSVWIGTRRGLTHLEHGRFQTLTQADGLGSDLVGALTRTADGDLWIATLNGLSRLHPRPNPGPNLGRLRNYTTADGLSSNVITALEATPDGMLWIGTQSNGLNLWDGTRFLAISGNSATQNAAHGGPLPKAIHAILQDDRGHLWLASDAGLTQVDAQSLLDCAQHGQCGLNAATLTNFTTADGLRSRETSSNSHPTALRAHNGQLWFTTPRGVAMVDPLHFPVNPASSPVVIEHFAVDDRNMDARDMDDGQVNDRNQDSGNRVRITAGALRVQFDYAGLSFAAPQKLRYQYMLEGFDHSWTDAGTRRTAYYTNIPPGSYRFRVRAAAGDLGFPTSAVSLGNASGNLYYGQPGAALSFELLPHFYQTVWFSAVILLLIAGLVLLVFRRRVLRVEREFRAVMAERNRIAREIHDTLAQGYVGISLQLEILGELLRHNRSDAAAKHLAVTQGLVREGLDDARQSIWALRSQDSGEKTLPIRLLRQVETAQDRNLSADLEVNGAYRALPADAEKEILRIAQEAIQNTKRHAAASRMRVRLEYDERTLTLTISDDGKGFALSAEKRRGKRVTAANATANAVEGHYGLTGMQERAAVIRGELAIESEPGNGTTVRLNVPAPEVSARNKGLSSASAGLEYPFPETTEASRSETFSATGTGTDTDTDKEQS